MTKDRDETNEAGSVLVGKEVRLRPLSTRERDRLATRIASDPAASPWWGSDADRIRGWLEEPEVTVFGIEIEGEVAGLIQFEEQNDPDYRYASIDISLLSPWTNRGYGPDALRTLARFLIEKRGHHRIQIDPSVDNHRAIRAYERVGFKRVGVLRRYERRSDGEWHDGLLMDLLAEELTE